MRSTDRFVGTSKVAASHTTTVTLPGLSVSVSTGPGVSLWDTVTLQSTVSSTRAAMIAADRPRGPPQIVLPPIEQGARTSVRRRADQSPIDTGGVHADMLSRADMDLDYRVDDALGRQPSVYDAYAGQSAGNAERAWAGQLSAYAGRNGFAQPANDWSPAQMHGYYEILEGANHPDLYSAADLRVKAQAYADRVNDINIGNDPQRLRQVFENEDRVLLTEYSALAAGGAVGAPAAALTGALTTSLGGGFLATGAGLAIDGAIGDATSQFVKMGAYHATGGVAGQRNFAYGELAGSAALPLVPLLASRGSSLLAYGARSAWGKVTAYGKMLEEIRATGVRGRSVPNDAWLVIQRGGAHGDVKGVPGYESHHIPADSISPLPTNRGPAIAMRIEDYRLTASWGNSREARAYRQQQAALIENGNFKAAQQLDIDDIRAKFGNKYDEAIQQMLDHTNKQDF